jgi:hypothetical protein
MPVGQMIDNVLQEVHRGSVGPVEILHDNKERLLPEPLLDQHARGHHDLALELFRIQLAGSHFVDAEDGAQHRRDGLDHLGFGSKRAQPLRQLLPSDVERIVGSHLVGFPEECSEDTVRGLAEGRAGRLPDGRAGQLAIGFEPPQELCD